MAARELSLVWDERFAVTGGDWRAVIPKVVDQFLACGLLEHGFSRIRCAACAHEYLPKRLRAYRLYRRPLLGDLARVAARAVTAVIDTSVHNKVRWCHGEAKRIRSRRSAGARNVRLLVEGL